MPRGLLVAVLLVGLAGCASPLLDEPDKVRHARVPLAPVFSPIFAYNSSEDGTSVGWSAVLGLLGSYTEAERRTSWLFPLWARWGEKPYSENLLIVPLYFGRNTATEHWRFFTPLYGWIESDSGRTDYVLGPILRWRRSHVADVWGSNLAFVYDWQHHSGRTDLELLPILGLASLARLQWGYPPDGETVPALGRSGSRRFELVDVLGIVTLFGYDDVGDRRELRLATLFSSEVLSPLRSWRGRGDDPFVREWIFPLYMNVADAEGGWLYVGPLWGQAWDTAEERHTDWWLAGLLARTTAPEGTTWRLLGLPVIGP